MVGPRGEHRGPPRLKRWWRRYRRRNVSLNAAGPVANPLPQALILTAIVIGFAVQAFAVVLIQRVIQIVGTDDLDQMKATYS